MNSALIACLALGSAISLIAQNAPKPPLQAGVSVDMAVAAHAVEMRAADEPDATVIAITADGRMFQGVQPVDLNSISRPDKKTVYLKADARVQYQKILAVLDALHGKQVILLTAPSASPQPGKLLPPYGVKLTVGE